jgi:hypothetical protein
MATLYVTEFNNWDANCAQEPAVTTQAFTFTTTTQSAAFNVKTRMVRLHTDAICSVIFGRNPSATTSSRRMVAGATEYFAVPADGTFKVAVVSNT